MTRQDLIIIATAMGRALARTNSKEEQWGVKDAIRELKGALSDINPRFDASKFDAAVEEEVHRHTWIKGE